MTLPLKLEIRFRVVASSDADTVGATIVLFTRPNGKRIKHLKDGGRALPKSATVLSVRFSDFRRMAARNRLQAGVPERIAVLGCGWEDEGNA